MVLAGLIQIGLGLARAGFIAAFFPSSVIKGLLAAIGVILILKQIPHVLGHDPDPEGDMAFHQPDRREHVLRTRENDRRHPPRRGRDRPVVDRGAVRLGQVEAAEEVARPRALVVVLLGVGISLLFRQFGGAWVIEPSHLVQVPVADSLAGFFGFLQLPDFSQWANPAVYIAAATLAVVASLETLLNLEAVDKLDPQQRTSPPSRELLAQGIGNVIAGLIGGLPITSVIVRSSVNINAGGKTKLAAIIHGGLLLVSVAFLPMWLNVIPLSCLAAILLVTGVKLASPALVKQMWNEGRYQFIPFAATVVAIVLTDLLIGVLIGLAVEHRLHPEQQHAPPDAPLRGEAPGRRCVAHRTGQSGELSESCRPVQRVGRGPTRRPRPARRTEHGLHRPGRARPDSRFQGSRPGRPAASR